VVGESADVVAAFGSVFDAVEDVRGEDFGVEVGAGEGAGHGHEGVGVVAEGESAGQKVGEMAEQLMAGMTWTEWVREVQGAIWMGVASWMMQVEGWRGS
jgi:hypothetical protein